MAAVKQAIYLVKHPFGGYAEGEEITLNPRQAQFLLTSGQIELKQAKASGKAVSKSAGGKA